MAPALLLAGFAPALFALAYAAPGNVEIRAAKTVKLKEPPMTTETIPFLKVSQTSLGAGLHTIGVDRCEGLGCIAKVTSLAKADMVDITAVGTTETTYPCVQPTTYTVQNVVYYWPGYPPYNGGYPGGYYPPPPPPPPPPGYYPFPYPPPNSAGSGGGNNGGGLVNDAHTVTITETASCPALTSVPPPPSLPAVSLAVPTSSNASTTQSATSTAPVSATSTLTCNKYGYLIQFATLYQVDLSTGKVTMVRKTVGDGSSINAIGFNSLDNFLYGVQSPSKAVLRISADGSSEAVATLSTFNPNVGDIDTNGTYWYSASGTNWAALDLKPQSPTYGKLISEGVATIPGGVGLADWVYLPSGGDYLYAVGVNSGVGNTALLKFSMATRKWELITNYANIKPAGAYGAQYGTNDGTLYASDNGSGDIYAFYPLTGAPPKKVSTGPKSSSNDGARCALASG